MIAKATSIIHTQTILATHRVMTVMATIIIHIQMTLVTLPATTVMVISILHIQMISETQPSMYIKVDNLRNAGVQHVLRKISNMQRYDTKKIQDVVSSLKGVKAASFSNKEGLIDLKKSTETCRIVDTLILPLYYIWDHCCHRNLDELSFEEHLRKAYQKFLQNPLTNTWELYLFVSIKTPFKNEFGKKNLSKELKEIYNQFLENK